MNLMESYHEIDKYIICEFNKTFTGKPKDYTFKKHMNMFSPTEQSKIVYLPMDIDKEMSDKPSTEAYFYNEKLMAGNFIKYVDLKNEDIVFAVDADEVIYSESYSKILRQLSNPFVKALSIPMHTFFYKINYLWQSTVSYGPSVFKVRYFKHKHPFCWRFVGKRPKEIYGGHFSWCMSVDQMITKLGSYSHAKQYGQFADKGILEEAIRNKKYPFEKDRLFDIRVLDAFKDYKYYPNSIYSMINEFKALIGN